MTWTSVAARPQRINARRKGKTGEREVVKLFKELFVRIGRADLAEDCGRNHQQAEKGGCDLVGCPGLSIEIKFGKSVDQPGFREAAWQQCLRARKGNELPVVFYRRNNRAWKVLTFVSLQSPFQTGNMRWIVAEYEATIFLDWYGSWFNDEKNRDAVKP